MKFRTQQFRDDENDDFYGNKHKHNHHHHHNHNHNHLSPPNFSKSPLIINRKIESKQGTKKDKMKKSSSSTTSNQMVDSNPGKWSLGSLMAALPLSPSPVCSISTATHSFPSSPFPCEASRTSLEFYTPTHQSSSVYSNLSFKKQDQSSQCMSMSTLYESAIDQGYRGGEINGNSLLGNYTYSPKSLLMSTGPFGYDSSSIVTAEGDDPGVSCIVLPPVPESGYPQRKRGATKCEDFARAEPVTVEVNEEHPSPVNRPKPYQEFLDEVQRHKERAELDAQRKAAYTDLLNKLKRKEAAIDCWESSQRSKAEFQLDKIERKLDKKRAKAVQKMHQKVAKAKMEAERKKARERRSALKEMAKLSKKIQDNKNTATVLWHPKSSTAG